MIILADAVRAFFLTVIDSYDRFCDGFQTEVPVKETVFRKFSFLVWTQVCVSELVTESKLLV